MCYNYDYTPLQNGDTVSAKITIGDLSKTMTVEQAQEMLDYMVSLAETTVDALIEHWTDDEGLHHIPFEKDLAKNLREDAERALYEQIKDLN